MRISDWRSDVCSSDLECRDGDVGLVQDLHELMQAAEIDMTLWFRALADVDARAPTLAPMDDAFYDPVKQRESEAALMAWLARYAARLRDDPLTPAARRTRTEEHTSELQSPMRISYAVLCLTEKQYNP